jgi:competence protein ComEC
MNPRIFTDVLNYYFPEPNASLTNGILFGIQPSKNTLFYEAIKETGLLHMVVLSGTNITILGAILGSVFGFLHKRLAVVLTICAIIAFIIFVGAQAPIVRAGVMGIITQVSILYRRKTLAIYSLLLSGIITGLIFPKMIGTLSFNLSYGATLGIILFGNTNKNSSLLWKELKPSLAAQLFTTPLIFWHFRQISYIAPLANLLTGWVVAPVMIFGFFTAIFGKIHVGIGYPFALIELALTSYLIFIIQLLAKVPFAFVQY